MKTFSLPAFLRRDYTRLALLSATAASLTWLIAAQAPWIDATIAALTCLISVKPTFHDTATEGFRQVLGTLLGAVVGYGLATSLGASAPLMFALILLCYVLARFLKLGTDGAAVMGLTVILVMGPLDHLAAIETRLAGVVLGAITALIPALWVRPGKPHERALHAAIRLGEQSAALLTEISEYLTAHHGKLPADTAENWRTRADETLRALLTVRHDAEAAAQAARWSPLMDRASAEDVLTQVTIAISTARTVHTMCVDLALASGADRAFPKTLALNLADVLSATADAISEQGEAAASNPAEQLSATDDVIQDLTDSHDEAVDQLRSLEDTQPLLLAGSLLRDAEKIAHTITDTTADASDDNPVR